MFEYFTDLRGIINKKEIDLVNYLNKIYIDIENKFDSLIYAVSEDSYKDIEEWKLKYLYPYLNQLESIPLLTKCKICQVTAKAYSILSLY